VLKLPIFKHARFKDADGNPEDVRAKIFHSMDFLKICTAVRLSYLCQKYKNKCRITVFVSDITRVESYRDFAKLAHVIQHGLQGFIVKYIEGE